MTTVLIQIKVKPRARPSSLTQSVDGKANEELVALVAEHFGCRKADVSIKSGASGRMKLITVETS